MDIKTVDIEKIIPYAKNPRKNDAAVDKVAASLKEFGFRQPIVVDAEMVVIAGHTRLAAARKLGLDQVPIHIATDLTANQIKAYRIADNRVSQEAKWDDDLLALELADLDLENYDLSKTGFNDDELAALMAEAITEGLVDEDQVPPEPETPVTVLGDIWQLGRHRVMCGDSTSIDAVDELMESQHPDMVFTDPPYNIDYQGVKDKRDKIKNDKMPDADFVDFLTASLLSCETMYVCCSWQYAHLFKDAMEKIARKPKAMIVWDKVNPAQNLDKYYKQHELIFYYGDFGGHKTLRGDVWKLKRQKNTMHPTMKPVELIEIALQDNVGKNLIYDAFGGSGSTLIACEKTNRQARLMELDPKYVDVIVKRWQDFTGLIAVNEKTGKTFNEMNNGSDHVSA
jgi:DNA modification methylase